MAEELARKRQQRAGHRSSAKRIISSVIDVLGGGDISQAREHEIKLKQQRDSLQQKLNTLRQLDACLLYTSPSPRDGLLSRMPSSA